MKKNMQSKQKDYNVFLIIISLLALIAVSVMLVGITFAYFTGKIKGAEESEVIIKSSNILLTYEQSNTIHDVEIFPGWEKELFFTIKNESLEDSLAKYEISLEILTPLSTAEIPDFLYELKGTTDAVGKTDVLVNKTATRVPILTRAIGIGTIANGITHSYSLKLKFIETNLDQNIYKNKTFFARVKVVRVPSI